MTAWLLSLPTALSLQHRAATQSLAHRDNGCAGTRLDLLGSIRVYLKEKYKKLMMVVVKLVVRRRRRHRGEAEPWRNKLTQSPSESTGLASRFGKAAPVRRGYIRLSPLSLQQQLQHLCLQKQQGIHQKAYQKPALTLHPIFFSIT